MSRLPIDIVNFDETVEFDLSTVINIANTIQDDFIFTTVDRMTTQKFRLVHLEENDGNEFLSSAMQIREDLAGYYPYIVFFSQNPLSANGWTNLFAHHDQQHGLAIVTTDNVFDVIIPRAKSKSYFLYYFARTIIKFLFSGMYNHDARSKRGCLFDFMEEKIDILKSMRANAICDECRREIRSQERKLSDSQYQSLDRLLTKSGQLFAEEVEQPVDAKARIFIGSSKEGLNIARKLKAGLRYDAHVDTWADGIFDEPGRAYIEVLEGLLDKYEYGIFVFSPDDQIFSRGSHSQIPRDNVIFEYGMFLGKHTRKKAFFIVPRGVDIKIMTDVLGITCLDYDPSNPNIQSAVNDACDTIRDLIISRRH